MAHQKKAYLALTVTSLVWGTTWVASKMGVSQMPAFELASIRQLLGGSIYVSFFLLRGEGFPTFKQFLWLIPMAFLMFVSSNGIATYGLQFITSGLAALIAALYPLSVVLIERFYFKAIKITTQTMIGLLLGLLGIVFIFYKDSLLEINELDSKINKTVSDNFKWKDDTLFIHKLAYLNYAEKNIELLSENEKYSLVNIENEKFLFVKEFKCLFPIKLDTSYSIKQYELLNDNLLMVCNKGLLVMNIPAQKFTKPLSKVSITSINNKIYDKTKPYLVPKKSILKLKFHTENLGAENELLIGKSLDRLTYTWEKFSIKEIVANNNENPIYFKVKNIRGDESEIIELNLDIKSDFNLNIINLILALILVLVYTFAIIWFITNKKNKEITCLLIIKQMYCNIGINTIVI